jgi:hypothetical protein
MLALHPRHPSSSLRDALCSICMLPAPQVEEKKSAPAVNPAQDKHPPAMRAYVERVFAAGIPPERKAAVQVSRPIAFWLPVSCGKRKHKPLDTVSTPCWLCGHVRSWRDD